MQLAIRLLIPPGSRLLELAEIRALAGPLDEAALGYPWSNSDSGIDNLQTQVQALVQRAGTKSNDQLFGEIWRLAHDHAGRSAPPVPAMGTRRTPAQLSEPWYCCAEPTQEQFALPFRQLPVQEWNDPNLRFVDITGVGIADVLEHVPKKLLDFFDI